MKIGQTLSRSHICHIDCIEKGQALTLKVCVATAAFYSTIAVCAATLAGKISKLTSLQLYAALTFVPSYVPEWCSSVRQGTAIKIRKVDR